MLKVDTTVEGYQAMLAFVAAWPERVWAIEGCAGIRRHIAHRLLANGQDIVDVPAKLSARARVFATGQGRKTDATEQPGMDRPWASRVKSTIPVSYFGPRPPSTIGLVDTWCHTCSSTPRVVTFSKRDSSAAAAARFGSIEVNTVRHVVPSRRANPCTEACSPPSSAIAHRHARAVNRPRGRATASSCSTNAPIGHAGSGHRQRRFRRTTVVGFPNAGASTSRTSHRPWRYATTATGGAAHRLRGGLHRHGHRALVVAVDIDHTQVVQADQQVATVAVAAEGTAARRRLGHRRGPREQKM